MPIMGPMGPKAAAHHSNSLLHLNCLNSDPSENSSSSKAQAWDGWKFKFSAHFPKRTCQELTRFNHGVQDLLEISLCQQNGRCCATLLSYSLQPGELSTSTMDKVGAAGNGKSTAFIPVLMFQNSISMIWTERMEEPGSGKS